MLAGDGRCGRAAVSGGVGCGGGPVASGGGGGRPRLW